MDEPIDYGAVAAYLKETRGLDYLDIPSNYHSNWMDNTRAKFELEWRPRYDLVRLIDAAWNLPARARRSPESVVSRLNKERASRVRPGCLTASSMVVASAALGSLISLPVVGRNAQILLKNSQIELLRKSRSCAHSVV